jgi:hypothetical protein
MMSKEDWLKLIKEMDLTMFTNKIINLLNTVKHFNTEMQDPI